MYTSGESGRSVILCRFRRMPPGTVYVNVNFPYTLQDPIRTPGTPMAAKKKTCWSIGELAREFDVTTRTIRFYEDEGLLKPTRSGQTRIYSAADRTALKLILRGKRLGFSLAESRQLIQMYNPNANRAQIEALLAKIHERRAQLSQQLRDIEVMQLELDEAEQRCLESLK